MKENHRKLHIVLFAAYCALMLWLLFHRPGYPEGIPYRQQLEANLNLIPLRTLKLFFRLLSHSRPYLVRAAVINLAGNVVMFIPLGLFLPLLFQKLRRFRTMLLWVALIISAVELAQLFTLTGSCDVDDLILNLTGAAIGYSIFSKGVVCMEKEATGTVVSVARQWWLKINTKPVRMHALDGAFFPHIAKVRYAADGKDYYKRKWIPAGNPVPVTGSTMTVLYCAENPKKAKVL